MPHSNARTAMVELLRKRNAPDALWSGSRFVDDDRKKDNCRLTCVIAIDIGFHDAPGKHAAPPDEDRTLIAQVAAPQQPRCTGAHPSLLFFFSNSEVKQ